MYISNEIGNTSPRLFYTPDEIKYDRDSIEIVFNNFSLIQPFIHDDDICYEQAVFKILYKKIKIENAPYGYGYEYVYVQGDRVEEFKGFYFPSQQKEVH